MTLLRLLAAASLCALTPAITTAQSRQFLPRGDTVLSGDDATITVDLPFPMGWPFNDASARLTVPVVTSLTISTNGIVYGGDTGSSTGVENAAAFVAGPPALAILWDDLSASDVSFGVPYPGVVVVTWTATRVGESTPFEMQLQIRRKANVLDDSTSNEIVFLYGDSVPAADGLVGVTRGNGATPVQGDLSSGPSGLASGTMFEVFTGSSPNDLQATSLRFRASQVIPGTTTETTAAATTGREACRPLVPGLTLTPVLGGYQVTRGATLDPDYLDGDRITIGLTNEISGPVVLPFAVPMPGGGSASTIYIDGYCRVSDDPSLTTNPFAVIPTIPEILSGPRTICPYWAGDWVTPGFVSIWLHQDAPDSVTITWRRGSFTERVLVQLRLFQNGTYQFVYDFAAPTPLTLAPAGIVAVSPGNGAADPGASDLSSTPFTSNGFVIYEQFPQFTPLPTVDLNNRINQSLVLEVLGPPALGTTLMARVLSVGFVPGSAVFFLGIPTGTPGFQPPISLSFLSAALAECSMLVDLATPGALLTTASGGPFATVPIIGIPVVPQLIGFHDLSIQALALVPGQSPLLRPTNEVRLTLGI
jgi:hypothetical protein